MAKKNVFVILSFSEHVYECVSSGSVVDPYPEAVGEWSEAVLRTASLVDCLNDSSSLLCTTVFFIKKKNEMKQLL